MFAFRAAPIRSSGRRTRNYDLNVQEVAGHIEVREIGSPKLLPSHCPERHINRDGTFCLGLRAYERVCDIAAARTWWDKLQVFLTCQETAHETGDWPKYAELSHGLAGDYQQIAEKLAAELGMQNEYKCALHTGTGPIAEMARRIDDTTLHLRNGRARCVCGRFDRGGLPLQRRDCWSRHLECLAILEFQRRQALGQFWSTFGQDDHCCGTMRDCPLRRPDT
jgi:hypothetical protein